MAAKQHLNQLKRQIEQLRKDSLKVVANANKIVSGGVQKLADRELKALNDYYSGALKSIKNANKKDLRGLAQEQLDLLQEAANQVISHARESLSIVAETRAELAKLVKKGVKGEKIVIAELNRAAAPAKKAVGKVKIAAKKAGKNAQKSIKKAGAQAKASADKALSSGKRKAAAAAKAVEQAVTVPSPNSRAGRATSKAKHVATAAAESFSTAVSEISDTVSEAVSKVTDAVKSQD